MKPINETLSTIVITKHSRLCNYALKIVQQTNRKIRYDKSQRRFEYEKMTEHQIVSILKNECIGFIVN